MVKWIGKFSLLLKRSRDAWMDMLPVSAMSQERRETQHRDDVTQLNEQIQGRNATALELNSQETRDHWYAKQVANHKRLFPFSDNLTTLMFIVISVKPKERDSQVPFSFQGMNVTAYTFEAARTVFLESFCTPKSSMENTPLRRIRAKFSKEGNLANG